MNLKLTLLAAIAAITLASVNGCSSDEEVPATTADTGTVSDSTSTGDSTPADTDTTGDTGTVADSATDSGGDPADTGSATDGGTATDAQSTDAVPSDAAEAG